MPGGPTTDCTHQDPSIESRRGKAKRKILEQKRKAARGVGHEPGKENQGGGGEKEPAQQGRTSNSSGGARGKKPVKRSLCGRKGDPATWGKNRIRGGCRTGGGTVYCAGKLGKRDEWRSARKGTKNSPYPAAENVSDPTKWEKALEPRERRGFWGGGTEQGE